MPELFVCFSMVLLAALVGLPVYGFILLGAMRKELEDSFLALRREVRDLKKELAAYRTSSIVPSREPKRPAPSDVPRPVEPIAQPERPAVSPTVPADRRHPEPSETEAGEPYFIDEPVIIAPPTPNPGDGIDGTCLEARSPRTCHSI